MAKRFTDTELWDKEWFMTLSLKQKCIVKFIRDKADLCGVWSPNFVIASAYIGEKITEKDILTIDKGNQFRKLDNGKIYCIGFVEFQYGNILSEKSPIHKKIIGLLENNGILNNYKKDNLYPINRVSNTLQEEEEEKEEVKVMVEEEKKVKEIAKIEKTEIELLFDEFLKMRVKIKKPATEKAIDLLKKKLNELSGGNEYKAIKIIEQSIVGGWQDFYELKQIQGNEDSKTAKLGKTYYTLLNEIKNESGETTREIQ
jgi:hypothetical protein